MDWSGASTYPLLEGLVEAGYDRKIYCYDGWEASASEVEKARNQGVNIEVGLDLRPRFLENVASVYENIEAKKGNIMNTVETFPELPVEICLFDAPKNNPLFKKCIQKLSPHWITGFTVLGLLDYYHFQKLEGVKREKFMAPVKFMEKNEENFTKLIDWPEECSCAFFRYEGGKLDLTTKEYPGLVELLNECAGLKKIKRRLWIAPQGAVANFVLDRYSELDFTIGGIIDIDPEPVTKLKTIETKSYSDLNDFEGDVIVASNEWGTEIKQKLIQNGIPEKNIIDIFSEFDEYISWIMYEVN